MRKNDFISENLRFCKILTQQKISAEDDHVLKNFIAENSAHIFTEIVAQQNKISKTDYITDTMRLCEILPRCEFGSREDSQIKKEIASNLSKISQIEAMESESRRNKKDYDLILKMTSCM